MRVTPTGQSLYKDGNEVGRYARDIGANRSYFVHYHDGLDGQAAWALESDVEERISVSVDTILVADHKRGLYAVDRDVLRSRERYIDGRPHVVAQASDDGVSHLGDDLSGMLRGFLWIESGNQIDEGYHKQKNEA